MNTKTITHAVGCAFSGGLTAAAILGSLGLAAGIAYGIYLLASLTPQWFVDAIVVTLGVSFALFCIWLIVRFNIILKLAKELWSIAVDIKNGLAYLFAYMWRRGLRGMRWDWLMHKASKRYEARVEAKKRQRYGAVEKHLKPQKTWAEAWYEVKQMWLNLLGEFKQPDKRKTAAVIVACVLGELVLLYLFAQPFVGAGLVRPDVKYPVIPLMMVAFVSQLALSGATTWLWKKLDGRYLPTTDQRFLASFAAAWVGLSGVYINQAFVLTGYASLGFLVLGPVLMAMILATVYQCEENIFQLAANKLKNNP
jgi:hypothetical protein